MFLLGRIMQIIAFKGLHNTWINPNHFAFWVGWDLLDINGVVVCRIACFHYTLLPFCSEMVWHKLQMINTVAVSGSIHFKNIKKNSAVKFC